METRILCWVAVGFAIVGLGTLPSVVEGQQQTLSTCLSWLTSNATYHTLINRCQSTVNFQYSVDTAKEWLIGSIPAWDGQYVSPPSNVLPMEGPVVFGYIEEYTAPNIKVQRSNSNSYDIDYINLDTKTGYKSLQYYCDGFGYSGVLAPASISNDFDNIRHCIRGEKCVFLLPYATGAIPSS
ncbi:hypothetical protein Pelo_19297 [Pelomyxa schiedti]|nr:hypothetical protein Pelo_19297 [Pelomyxa schiedti]